MENLTRVEAQHVIVARKNAELATKMIALAEEANTQKKEDIKDPSVRAQLDELEKALKVSRQRWRIMKGTASAVVAGSGIDWSRDATLRDLVLDTEGDWESLDAIAGRTHWEQKMSCISSARVAPWSFGQPLTRSGDGG